MSIKHKLIMKLRKVCSEYDTSLNPHPGDATYYYFDELQDKAIYHVSNKLLKKWIEETKKKIS